VILAMINENLNRLMNSFRLFYTYPAEDMFLGFKPILVSTDSGFQAMSFAPADVTDRNALRRALREAARYDWFYQHRTARMRFPFTAGAVGFVKRHGTDSGPGLAGSCHRALARTPEVHPAAISGGCQAVRVYAGVRPPAGKRHGSPKPGGGGTTTPSCPRLLPTRVWRTLCTSTSQRS
jgi:hypothetical protein